MKKKTQFNGNQFLNYYWKYSNITEAGTIVAKSDSLCESLCNRFNDF